MLELDLATAGSGEQTQRSGTARMGRAILATSQGKLGLFLLLLIGAIVSLGPIFAPHDPTAVGIGPSAAGPTGAFPLGTDTLGRDVLSRFLTGGSSLLVVPIAAVSLAFALGGSAGAIFGYLGGRGDLALTRVIDVMLPIPDILIALILLARFGGSALALVLIVGIVGSPRVSRVVRGATQNIKSMEFILAAEARGEKDRTVIFRELLPNIAGPVLVEYGIRICFAVTFVASLNFLGLAAQPPSSNWGLMISEGRNLLFSNPVSALVPAIAIGILVVGINLVTDAASQVMARGA